ncbi:hypothetical protein [Micromonospora sp. NPDC000729]|uniref:hypothetical protein n=1 Tax=Micromonospora sp. NPDC000729 TaxID=3364220 RepID=UPI0036B1CE12
MGGRLPRRARPASRRGYLIGGLTMVFGALLAQSAVRLGAEDSTIQELSREYGGVGSYATPTGRFTAPAAGAYAIYAVGFAPADPDCRLTGGGSEVRAAEPVSVPPGDYGGDAASFAWVATVRVPTPGSWTLDCRTSDPDASYVVGDVPEIRGAVGELIHWPVGVIWLLGALPGLLIVADTARRRRASRTAVLTTPEIHRGRTICLGVMIMTLRHRSRRHASSTRLDHEPGALDDGWRHRRLPGGGGGGGRERGPGGGSVVDGS